MDYKRSLLCRALPLMMGGAPFLLPSSGRAEPVPTVAQARQLFSDALRQQEEGFYVDALAKLQRVQSFRDTSPVRYQIAKCTEGSGRFSKARELYLRSVDGTQIPSSEDAAVASASRDAATKLATRIGYVRIDGPAMQDNERLVLLDDDEWAGAGLHEVDPGPHELRIKSDEGKMRVVPFTATTMATTAVKLFHTKNHAIAPPPRAVVKAEPMARGGGSPTPWTWVAFGGGAAFLTGGIVMLVVRKDDISTIQSTCPGDRCPGSSRSDIESRQSRASTLGVLGITATAVGAAGLAVGGGLLLFGPRSHPARAGLAPLPGGAQLLAVGSF